MASSGQSSGEAALRAVDLESGKVRWREKGLGRSNLTYADGHLLVLTETGRLLLVKAAPERFVKGKSNNRSQGSGNSRLRVSGTLKGGRRPRAVIKALLKELP